MTPVLEFAEVIDRAQEGGLREAFRLFDDHGRVLVLRPDLTIPVARLVATRMADHPARCGPSTWRARSGRRPSGGRGPRSSARPGWSWWARRPRRRRRGDRPARRQPAGDRPRGPHDRRRRRLPDGRRARRRRGRPRGARAGLRAALAARDLAGWRRLARGAAEGPAGGSSSAFPRCAAAPRCWSRSAAGCPRPPPRASAWRACWRSSPSTAPATPSSSTWASCATGRTTRAWSTRPMRRAWGSPSPWAAATTAWRGGSAARGRRSGSRSCSTCSTAR